MDAMDALLASYMPAPKVKKGKGNKKGKGGKKATAKAAAAPAAEAAPAAPLDPRAAELKAAVSAAGMIVAGLKKGGTKSGPEFDTALEALLAAKKAYEEVAGPSEPSKSKKKKKKKSADAAAASAPAQGGKKKQKKKKGSAAAAATPALASALRVLKAACVDVLGIPTAQTTVAARYFPGNRAQLQVAIAETVGGVPASAEAITAVVVRIEAAANAIVAENAPITTCAVAAADAAATYGAALDGGALSAASGTLVWVAGRLLSTMGADESAVATTGALGRIEIGKHVFRDGKQDLQLQFVVHPVPGALAAAPSAAAPSADEASAAGDAARAKLSAALPAAGAEGAASGGDGAVAAGDGDDDFVVNVFEVSGIIDYDKVSAICFLFCIYYLLSLLTLCFLFPFSFFLFFFPFFLTTTSSLIASARHGLTTP